MCDLRNWNEELRNLLVWSCITMLSLVAAEVVEAGEREHDAHVHGVSRLNIAVEGRTIEMELIAPGTDIVGFERTPKSAKDKAAVAAAVEDLVNGGALFMFPGEAQCHLEEAEVVSSLIDAHPDHHEEDGDHHDEDHGEAHSEVQNAEHAEFHVHYRFQCDYPDRLSHIQVGLFERFPTARELEVQLISPYGQSAQELTPNSSRLNF